MIGWRAAQSETRPRPRPGSYELRGAHHTASIALPRPAGNRFDPLAVALAWFIPGVIWGFLVGVLVAGVLR